MITISKSELAKQLLSIFRQIEENGEAVIVTENDRPVLRIEPIVKKQSVDEAFAEWRGKVIFHEDPDTPTIDEWNEV